MAKFPNRRSACPTHFTTKILDSQQIDGDDVDDDIKTNGLDFSVFWDNRDFYANPSKGFGLRGKVSRDFGWSSSSNSWTKGIVIRIDTAVSDEEFGVQMMVSQPFQF